MPKPRLAKKRSKPEEPMHEIHDGSNLDCSCARCVGYRLYPNPSLCDWCNTVHAGNGDCCEINPRMAGGVFGNGYDVSGYEQKDIDVFAVDTMPGNDVRFARYVSMCERHLNEMKRHIIELKEETLSLKSMIDAKSNGNAGNLLKGTDVPARIKSVVITVKELRESPDGFTAPFIIDLKTELYGASAWAVNKTNAKAILKLFGDDEKKIRGKKIKLDVISVRNPQSGEVVPSLAVSPRQ